MCFTDLKIIDYQIMQVQLIFIFVSQIRPFSEHFKNSTNLNVVCFSSLGKDATLVVPMPKMKSSVDNTYAHLFNFMNNNSDREQLHQFWIKVAEQIKRKMHDTKERQKQLWVSTCGTGVSWLHVRLDTYPKSYCYESYKKLALNPIPPNVRDRPRSRSRSRTTNL